MSTKIKGIDISTWQGTPDFEKVKAAGIEFVIIRAGYGGNHIDNQFKRNATECNRLGIPIGVYWFSYALTPAQAAQEARYCLEAVKPYHLEYPIFFDLEYDTVRYAKQNGVTIDKTLATQLVTAFCEEIEKADYYAANYMNLDYAKNMFDMKALAKYDIWYARYTSTIDRSDAGLWQYSSTGKVDGISGNVDMDYSLRDYPAIIKNAGLNGFEKPIEKPQETPQEPPGDGYPEGTPAWQKEGFEALVERGIVNVPDYWKARFDKPMTAGEIFAVISKV